MSKLTVSKERGYIGNPGLCFPLPDGITNPDDRNHPNTRFARFPGPQCTFFTKYKEIQDAIEASKYFISGSIRRVPTKEEAQEAKEKAKINQFIESKKKEIEAVGTSCLPNEASNYDGIIKFAELVGIGNLRSVPPKTKESILEKIYKVFGETYEPQKEKGK